MTTSPSPADDRVVGFVQARLGSERVRSKNLRMVGDLPVVAHGVRLLTSVPEVETAYINTESPLIAQVAEEHGATWYQRPAELATSDARTDDWVADFLSSVPCDVVAVVNPCVVFLRPETASRAIRMVTSGEYDTVIAASPVRTHILSDGRPENFAFGEKLPRSQDLPVLHALNWGVAVWRRSVFLSAHASTGVGVLSGRVGVVEIDGKEAVDIDNEEDFQIADALARAGDGLPARYHPVLDQRGS